LKLYEKLAGTAFESADSKTDNSNVQEQAKNQSKQQSLYELQQAKFNSRALELLNI